MISVSDAWKEAHRQTLLPEAFVEITLTVGDIPKNVTVSATNEATFSNSDNIIKDSDVSAKYAVLEHNLWSLDGSCSIMDASKTAPGYVSATAPSGNDGVTITIDEVSKNTIPGVTITWSKDYEAFAEQFFVVVKNRATGAGEGGTWYNNTSNVSVLDIEVSEYDCVEVYVHKWSHPDQRVRIENIKLGHSVVFGKDEIISYSNEQSGSPLGTELTKNSIEFEVDNADGRWNFLNPTGIAKYLFERQRLVVRYGQQTYAGVEWIQAGVFYLTEWKAPSNGITARFVARDALEFALNATYSRHYLTGVTTGDVDVYSTKEAVFSHDEEEHAGALLTTIPSGTEVKIYERSFQYANYDDDPDGAGWSVLRIEQGWVYPFYVSYTIPNLGTDVIAALESCLPHDVFVGDFLVRPEAPASILDQPVAELVQQACVASAGTMQQYPDGNIALSIPIVTDGANYVISRDISYFHPEVDLAKTLKEVNIVGHYPYNASATKTETFRVNDTGDSVTIDAQYAWKNDLNLIQHIANTNIAWWKHREIVSGEFRADPRLELFDCVKVETKYGTLSPVMITYLKYTYNGAFRAVYEGKVVDESINLSSLEV